MTQWILAGALLAGTSGCGGETLPTGSPFELAPGDSALLEGGVPLTFVGVTGDSRCPADVTCIWEGDASVALRVGPPPGQEFVLHTSGAPGMPRTAEACGHRLELAALAPAPARAGVPVPRGEYRVRLVYSADAASGGVPDDCRPQRLR